MNLTFFKNKVDETFGSVENFAQELGLSKNAIYKWLKTDRLPEDRIVEIVEFLKLSEDELNEFFAIPKTELYFRKVGRDEPCDDELKKQFKALANTFFKLESSSDFVDDGLLSGVTSRSPSSIANYLRALLNIEKDEPAILYKIISELRRHKINLYFIPFQKFGFQLDTNKRKREVAFTARKGSKIIIFLDTGRRIDEANFDVIHELTHIVCNHNPGAHRDEDEKICNDVAEEVVYPRLFLEKNLELLDPFINAKKHSWQRTIELFQNMEVDFDWSPMGLALALRSYGHIKDRSAEFIRLMKIDGFFKKQSAKVGDLYYEAYDPTNYDKLVTFFEKEIQKDKEIYKPIIDLKRAATFEKISPRRFAEIFCIDAGDADELVNSWRLKEEDFEDTQEATNAEEG